MAYIDETDKVKTLVYNTLEYLNKKIDAVDSRDAFSKFAVDGQTTIEADEAGDTLTLVGSRGVTLTTNATTDTLTIEGPDLSSYATTVSIASPAAGQVQLTRNGTAQTAVSISGWSDLQPKSTAVTHTASTAVGSTSQGVYIASNGAATAMSATIGGATTPVYLSSGVITAGTALGDAAYKGVATSVRASTSASDDVLATEKAVRAAVDGILAEKDALVYKGTVAGTATAPGAFTVAANKGDVYKVSAAGYVNGVKVEAGDMFICNTDSTAAATSTTYSTVQAKWDVIQTNLDVNSIIADALPKLVVSTTGTGNAVTAVTSTADHTITVSKGATFLTAHPSITQGSNTSSTASPAHGGTFTAIDSITKDANGHVTAYNTKTVTLPSETAVTVSTTGTGNAVTAVTSTADHTITVTKGASFLTAETPITVSTTGTGNAVTAITSTGAHTITVSKGATYLTSYTESNDFAKVTDGTSTATAASKGDTLTVAASGGAGVSISGKTLTISAPVAYTHPTSDGAKHVPATGTTNNGNVLVAGASAGAMSWKPITDVVTIPTLTVSSTGTGNAITAVSSTADHTITVTKGATFLTAETPVTVTVSGTGNGVASVTSTGAHAITVSKTDFLTAETPITVSTTGTGNAVTAITSTGAHTITVSKGATYLTAETPLTVSVGGTGAFLKAASSTANHTITLTKGNAATNEVTACTSYSKGTITYAAATATNGAQATAPTIATTDTLNTALGKLEAEGEVALSVYNAFAKFTKDNNITGA